MGQSKNVCAQRKGTQLNALGSKGLGAAVQKGGKGWGQGTKPRGRTQEGDSSVQGGGKATKFPGLIISQNGSLVRASIVDRNKGGVWIGGFKRSGNFGAGGGGWHTAGVLARSKRAKVTTRFSGQAKEEGNPAATGVHRIATTSLGNKKKRGPMSGLVGSWKEMTCEKGQERNEITATSRILPWWLVKPSCG